MNNMLDSLCEQLETKHRLSTTYHPQTNGLVKCFNWTLCETLAKYASGNKDDWDLYISSVLFAYRTKRHNTTQHELFYLMYGQNATLPIEFVVETALQVSQTDDNWQEDLLKRVHTLTGKIIVDGLETQDTIHKAQQKQIQRHNEELREINFNIGDLVLLYQSQFRGKQKLLDRWKGPYYIHEVLGNGVYKLRIMDGSVLKVPVNAERLKHYQPR